MRFKVVKKPSVTEVKKKRGPGDVVKSAIRLKLYDRRQKAIEQLYWGTLDGEGKDAELKASQMLKIMYKASQAGGEMGERFALTKRSHNAWRWLLLKWAHSEAEYGEDHNMTKVLANLILGASVDMTNRAVKTKDTDVEIVSLPLEMLMGGRYRPASQIDDLTK